MSVEKEKETEIEKQVKIEIEVKDTKKNYTLQMWEREGMYEANLILIESMSKKGMTQKEIAEALNISLNTLGRLKKLEPRIDKAIKYGRSMVVANCQNALMKAVNDGNITAIIYALKIYGGDFFNDKYQPRQQEKLDRIETNLSKLVEAINSPSAVADDEGAEEEYIDVDVREKNE